MIDRIFDYYGASTDEGKRLWEKEPNFKKYFSMDLKTLLDAYAGLTDAEKANMVKYHESEVEKADNAKRMFGFVRDGQRVEVSKEFLDIVNLL